LVWIRTVKEEDADGELARIYQRIRGTRGRTSNIFVAQSLNPEALESHLDLYLKIMYGKGTLTRRQREMIAVVVSAANNCEYCVVHHSAALKKYVDDERLLNHLARDFRDADLEPKERAMLEYATKLTATPHLVSEEDPERLRAAGLGDEEILHVALVTGYFNFVNRLASGLGVTVEAEHGAGYSY